MKRILLIMLLAATVAHAEMYKWTDGEGTVHFSDSRVEIPERFRKSAEPLGMDFQSGSNDDAKAGPAGMPTKNRTVGDGQTTAGPSRMEGLKERMQNDEGIMTLIRALQDDPEMQSLLQDPSVLSAVQAGDVSALTGNPAFLKILNNSRVREIGKKLGTSGEGVK